MADEIVEAVEVKKQPAMNVQATHAVAHSPFALYKKLWARNCAFVVHDASSITVYARPEVMNDVAELIVEHNAVPPVSDVDALNMHVVDGELVAHNEAPTVAPVIPGAVEMPVTATVEQHVLP